MTTEARPYPSTTSSAIYRGTGRGRALGPELSAMRLAGQEVIKQQRGRWQYNRAMYRGEQYIRPTSMGLRSLAPQHRLPSGKRRDVVNRSRRFIDGRAAMITMSKPGYQVPPENNTRQAYQAADLGTKVLDYYWDFLDLGAKFRTMVRSGDVDGVAFLTVYYDRAKGETLRLPFSEEGRPIADPDVLYAMDAMGTSTWEMEERTGDICVRNVPIGRLAIDPLARDGFHEARWIIESRVRGRDEVERESGRPIEQIIKQAKQNTGVLSPRGGTSVAPGTARLSVDEFDESDSTLSGRDYILTHEAFIKPTGKAGDWPDGGHIMWIDQAPDEPIFMEKWKYDLPYVCYVPQPDDGHFLRSRAVMDDLAPLNVALNRAVSQYHELLDLHARSPLLAQRGALVSKFVYNEKRIVEYNAGFETPRWMQMPPEPVKLLDNIQFLLEQMAEIAVQNDVARGTPPGQGIDAGVSLNLLAQQNEQQMAGLESAVKTAIESVCTRILREICEHFTVQRTISIPGVYGVEEVNNFVGSMLRGCTRVRVTGSLLPRNKAAQQATIMQLVAGQAIDIRPYVTQLTEGRIEEVITDLERHEREQRNENRDMDLLGSIPNIDEIWAEFQQMRQAHAEALAEYEEQMQQAEVGAAANDEDPEEAATLMPSPPPPPVLANIGIKVPMPNDWNDDAAHLAELDRRRTMDGYKSIHPLVRQAYHEHAQEHQKRLSEQMNALRPQPGQVATQMGAEEVAPQVAGLTPPAGGGEGESAGAAPTPTPPAPTINVNFGPESFVINNDQPDVTVNAGSVNVEAPNMPDVVVNTPDVRVEVPPSQVVVDRPAPPGTIRLGKVERDKEGRIIDFELRQDEEE